MKEKLDDSGMILTRVDRLCEEVANREHNFRLEGIYDFQVPAGPDRWEKAPHREGDELEHAPEKPLRTDNVRVRRLKNPVLSGRGTKKIQANLTGAKYGGAYI